MSGYAGRIGNVTGAVLVGGRICLTASIRGGSERLDGFASVGLHFEPPGNSL